MLQMFLQKYLCAKKDQIEVRKIIAILYAYKYNNDITASEYICKNDIHFKSKRHCLKCTLP